MSKYNRIIHKDGKHLEVDVYDVIDAFNVKCPALQHLLKKALNPGLRGHKDEAEDLQDIFDSAARAISLANDRADGEMMDFIAEEESRIKEEASDNEKIKTTAPLNFNITSLDADAFTAGVSKLGAVIQSAIKESSLNPVFLTEEQAKLDAAESDQFDLSNDESVNAQANYKNVLIRGTSLHSFKRCEWAVITGVQNRAPDGLPERPVYAVKYADGTEGFIAISDSENYELS